MATRGGFQLQFDGGDIASLAARYGYRQDDEVMDAGRKIKAGEYTRANLATIYEWKTNGRGRSRIDRNSDDEIADALQLATIARSDRAAMAVLVGLNGVEVPVASAILTAIDPERYTIIDFRALAALGTDTKDRTINLYLDYLETCRSLARHHRVTLRDRSRPGLVAVVEGASQRPGSRDFRRRDALSA